MGCRWYLAMTGAEFLHFDHSCPAVWMSARFSACHGGLSELPDTLGSGCMLMVDDLVPFGGHDPRRIALEAARAADGCDGILLDFQRQWDSRAVVEAILRHAPCPVGVSSSHAGDSGCAVFLSPNLNAPLARPVQHWQGRELWLDVAAGMQTFTVERSGCRVSPILPPEGAFPQKERFYDYRIEKSPDAVVFSLYRSADKLPQVLQEAASLGITRAVGLEQEYKKSNP